MDRIYPCGGYDVGSIPTGSTKDRNIPLERDLLLWCWAERCEASSPNREPGPATELCDGKARVVGHCVEVIVSVGLGKQPMRKALAPSL